MKIFVFITAIIITHIGASAQSNTHYILVPKDELTQPIVSQLKGFADYQAGKFMQDDTSTLREIVFEQDTTKVYVVLSWEGVEPSSIAAEYHLDSLTLEHRIFTEAEIKEHIRQNEHPVFEILAD